MENDSKRRKKKQSTVNKFKDLKNDYVKRLLWRGINNITRHDAVKENDGPRMIKNHPKYLIYCMRLLLNMAGATSERIKHGLLRERTVNI
ncbi:hypothetical protein KUTeg_012094 [Tegillarca granosa]|uniref:Uncharacterized protein n=1 Tax=Tegillarca granosa TaxID=220873 RepID=A0ABQ9EYS6_TEGGR|nr:hypothetical protein KUTeg_012094 [Tegillarca granosa]